MGMDWRRSLVAARLEPRDVRGDLGKLVLSGCAAAFETALPPGQLGRSLLMSVADGVPSSGGAP